MPADASVAELFRAELELCGVTPQETVAVLYFANIATIAKGRIASCRPTPVS